MLTLAFTLYNVKTGDSGWDRRSKRLGVTTMADDNPVLYERRRGGGAPHPQPAGTTERVDLRHGARVLRRDRDRADADPNVRVVVVTGSGKAFCPGLDMEVLRATAEVGVISTAERRPQTYALGLRKPLVAAINGACAGIGLVQALVADLRPTSTQAGTHHDRVCEARPRRRVQHGLAAPTHHGLRSAALDLLLSGRVVGGTEAHAIGLVSHLCEPDDVLDSALASASDRSQLLADVDGRDEATGRQGRIAAIRHRDQ